MYYVQQPLPGPRLVWILGVLENVDGYPRMKIIFTKYGYLFRQLE